MKHPHPTDTGVKWRIGLLVTTMAMGIALVGTGVSGYFQAQKNARMLAAAEVGAMMVGLRRELSRNPLRMADSLTEFVADSEDSPIHAAALLGPGGEVEQTFGKNKRAFDPEFLRQSNRFPRDPAPFVELYDDGVVHAVFPLPKRFGRRQGRFPTGGWERHIAVEAISKSGPAIVSSALLALVIELFAAVALLGAALLFLRQKASADRRAQAIEEERREMAVQLERDERLKALGRMSAVLGHELRNPIAALKGHAQLLLEKIEETHPGRPRALTIVEEAKLLENLTLQILDFVRTGELSYSKVYLDDLASSAAVLSGVEPVAVLAAEGVTCCLDRARMEQALINLLVNAGQVSPPGEVIDLTVESDTSTLRIRVRDRGPGIPKEDLERIFQPFYTSRAQGTGLGLALVKRIATAHGGDVVAKNHKEGGAVFTIEIPMRHSLCETGAEDA